jgi:hypothetical protein
LRNPREGLSITPRANKPMTVDFARIESIATCVMAIASLSVIWQLRQGREQLRQTLKWNRLTATFTLFNLPRFNECRRAVARRLMAYGYDLVQQTEPMPSSVVESVRANQESMFDADDYLNLLEDYAAAVNVGMVDAAFAYQLMATVITRDHRLLKPLIERTRSVSGQPDCWIELTKLADKWTRMDEDQTQNRGIRAMYRDSLS